MHCQRRIEVHRGVQLVDSKTGRCRTRLITLDNGPRKDQVLLQVHDNSKPGNRVLCSVFLGSPSGLGGCSVQLICLLPMEVAHIIRINQINWLSHQYL